LPQSCKQSPWAKTLLITWNGKNCGNRSRDGKFSCRIFNVYFHDNSFFKGSINRIITLNIVAYNYLYVNSQVLQNKRPRDDLGHIFSRRFFFGKFFQNPFNSGFYFFHVPPVGIKRLFNNFILFSYGTPPRY